MHNMYTFTLHVLILAGVLLIVAIQFCRGKTILIKNNYERPHVLTAQNANVAQINVGIEYFSFMNVLE